MNNVVFFAWIIQTPNVPPVPDFNYYHVPLAVDLLGGRQWPTNFITVKAIKC